jgi:hypothetical protein
MSFLDAALFALCLNAYDLASLHAGLAGLEAVANRFDEAEIAAADALVRALGGDEAAIMATMHDGYRAVAGMTGEAFAAQLAACDAAMADSAP